MKTGVTLHHEQLESRTLLSVTYAGRVLGVVGTSGNDVLSVALKNGRVAVFENGVQTASFATVRSITVEGGGGRDKIAIDPKITVSTKLTGGSGSDSIVGGSGPDVLYGNSGNDLLIGGAGVDALLGGDNNDTLDGGTGDDYLDGQSGNDTVTYANRTSAIKASIGWEQGLDNDSDESTDSNDYYLYGRGGVGSEQDKYANIDTLIGTAFADRIRTFINVDYAPQDVEGNDYPFPLLVEAGAGNDMIDQSTGSDGGGGVLRALIRCGEGNDTFEFEGYTQSTVLGEAGNDTLLHTTQLDDGIAKFDGGEGYDIQNVAAEIPFLVAFSSRLADGIEEVYVYPNAGMTLTEGSDTVNVRIVGEVGQVDALGGNDRVTVLGTGKAIINGGDGNDTLIGSTGNDTLDGGDGNDTVSYASRTAPITATLRQYMNAPASGTGGQTGETDQYYKIENILGGVGNDTLAGGYGDYDAPDGTPGIGEESDARIGDLRGGAGDDTFDYLGNFEHAAAYGEAGNDRFMIGSDDDASYAFISGGAGVDWQIVADSESYYAMYLAPDVENAETSAFPMSSTATIWTT